MCQEFTPILAQFYFACAKDGKFEVVYVSSDRKLSEFMEYFETMPWLSIPLGEGSAVINNTLSQRLSIKGIPTLVVVDAKTGELISTEARSAVSLVGGDVAKGKELIAEWKAAERKPMPEATEDMGGAPPSKFMVVVSWLFQNPMSIGALFFCLNYLRTKWIEYSANDHAPIMEEAGAGLVGGEESEF